MNNAIFYWDLSERDRAALSREDVERYVDAELMSKGVLKAKAPVLEDVPEISAHQEQRYRVKGAGESYYAPKLLFRTEADAEAFLKLGAEWETCFYHDGISFDHGAAFDGKIDVVRVLTAAEWQEHRPRLESVAAIKAANKKASEEYEKACKVQRDALSGLWDDWTQQRARDRNLRGVIETFEEYKRTAGGDAETALRFLRKVHSESLIDAAAEWCGVKLPIIDECFAEVEAPPEAHEKPAEAIAF